MANNYSAYLQDYSPNLYGAAPDAVEQRTIAPTTSQITRPNNSNLPESYRTYLGGSSGQTSSSQSVSTTRTIRKGEAPNAPDLPKYSAPKVDKRKLKALTQKAAAPGIRRLRETVQQAMGQNFDNPNLRRLTLREALRGYGAGLENVMSGASKQARSEHMAELELQRDESLRNWQAETQKLMQAYQNAWGDYMKGEATVTESNSGSQSGSDIAPTVQWTRSALSGQFQLTPRNPFATY